MSQPLKVLIVEDNPADAELLVIELTRAGFEPDWRRVDTEAAFLEQLNGGLDLILSDYRMPAFNGLSALELLKQSGLEIPFILVSGTIGEDTAVQAMKNGATDYLLKDRLVRLGSAVLHALAEFQLRRERRKADDAAQRQLAELRVLFDLIPAMICFKDTENRILRVNRRMAETAGKSVVEIEGKPSLEIYPAEAARFYVDDLKVIKSGEPQLGIVETIYDRDGKNRWVQTDKVPVFNQDGKVTGIVVMAQDITDRHHAEITASRLAAIVESSDDAIIGENFHGIVSSWNKGAKKIFGYAAHEMIGTSIARLMPPGREDEEIHILKNIRKGKSVEHFETLRRTKTGKLIDISVTVFPIKDATGGVIGVAKVARDVTAQKQSQEALRDSEERFAGAFEQAPIGLALVLPDGHWLKVNRALCDLVGYSDTELLGGTFQDITYPEDLPADLEYVRRMLAGEISYYQMEKRYVHSKGSLVTVSLTASLVRDRQGLPRYFISQLQDISERKRAEQVLRESEVRLRFLNDLGEATRALADPAQIMAVTARMLGGHLRASRCAYAMVEKDGDQFTILHDYTNACASSVGSYQLLLFGPQAVAKLQGGQILVICNVETELLAEEGGAMFNAIGIKAIITCPLVKDGGLRAMMAVHQSTPRDWKTDEIALVQEVVERCWVNLERISGEEALRTSEKRFKALFEQTVVGVALADATTGRFEQVNKRFCEIAGRSCGELEQLTFSSITHPQDEHSSAEMTQQFRAGVLREFTQEKRYLREDGSEVWAIVTVSAMWAPGEAPNYFIVVVQDISERKRLEEQVRQTQKMEAIGTLAGGIAHDFNNILAGIGGYTELARMTLKGNPAVREYLDTVLLTAGRASHLVRQILTFSRQEPLERTPIQLLPVVMETFDLLRATIPSTIEFDLSLAKDAPTVFADATQIHQILMNLGTNAWHAMKDHPGRLQVKLEKFVVDAGLAAETPKLHPGIYARLSVRDNGSGMDQATLLRIYEPFFTTKPVGEGTGLGLAVVHGIINNHDGVITVESQPGEGTTFRVYLPAYAGDLAATVVDAKKVPRGHGEQILVVDDEELLAMLTQRTLIALGYGVEFATKPSVALALVRSEPERFALVITDQTMPGMTGLVLATQLRDIRQNLPVILTTGYTAAVKPELVEAAGIRQVLLKPATVHSLATAVHDVLVAESSVVLSSGS